MKTCVICGKSFKGWGHNPAPIYKEGKACTDCNLNLVVPVRIKKLTKSEVSKIRERIDKEGGYSFEN